MLPSTKADDGGIIIPLIASLLRLGILMGFFRHTDKAEVEYKCSPRTFPECYIYYTATS